MRKTEKIDDRSCSPRCFRPQGRKADGVDVTSSLVLADGVAYIAVDAIAASAATLFLSFIPPIKIVHHATNEVFFPIICRGRQVRCDHPVRPRTARPLPFVYSLSRTRTRALRLTVDNHLPTYFPVLEDARYRRDDGEGRRRRLQGLEVG